MKITLVFPIFAIMIGVIRLWVNHLQIKGTAFEFSLKSIPPIAYSCAGVFFIVIFYKSGWDIFKEDTISFYMFLSWLIGFAIIYFFSRIKF